MEEAGGGGRVIFLIGNLGSLSLGQATYDIAAPTDELLQNLFAPPLPVTFRLVSIDTLAAYGTSLL